MATPGAKIEGKPQTPQGTYGFSFFFGVLANPGVSFPYRRAHTYDVWDDDPASPLYNEWVDTRVDDPGLDPEPLHNVPVYNYAAVIAYTPRGPRALAVPSSFTWATGRPPRAVSRCGQRGCSPSCAGCSNRISHLSP